MQPVASPVVGSIGELAQARGVRDCLHWFTREKQWINEQHLQLCRVPAATFLEQKRAEWMLAQFRAYGCEAELDRAGNVVAWHAPDLGGPLVALTAHLDTVLAPRAKEDITVEADGTLRGPGVADNGAGLAALLAMARAIRSCPPLPDSEAGLVLAANTCEEGEGNLSGMRYLCQQSPLASRVKAFVVLDGPATDHITCEALASRRFEIAFTGPGGHSWSDYGVGNPIHALSRAIALFSEQRLNGDGAEPRTSFNFGMIEGGSSVNAIPSMARAKLDIRSRHERRIDELVSFLNAAVDRAMTVENERCTAARVAVRIKEIGARPGGRLPDGARILACIRAVDAHLGIRARLDCASTDANIPLSLGLPALSIGAGGQGGGAHTPAEWFHPEARDLGLKRIFLTLCLLLRDPAPFSG